jgi:hypothetical protein
MTGQHDLPAPRDHDAVDERLFVSENLDSKVQVDDISHDCSGVAISTIAG